MMNKPLITIGAIIFFSGITIAAIIGTSIGDSAGTIVFIILFGISAMISMIFLGAGGFYDNDRLG